MKAIDRFRVIKRAVLTALNPSLEVLNIQYTDKKGKLFSRYIHSDRKKVMQVYLADMQRAFTDHSDSAESVEIKLINFVQGIEERWNKDHPNDPLKVVKRKEEKDNDRMAQEPCMGVHPDSSVLPDVPVADGELSNG